MNKREQSRQQWEQEIVRRKQNITPADYPEGVHYARIKGLPRIVSQVRFWLGIVLLVAGIVIFRPTAFAAALAGLAIALGLLLAITAMDWKDTSK